MQNRAGPGDGRSVPLRISFIGLKGVKWLSLGHNNFRPLLVLFEDHLVQRVIFSKSRAYSGIERVDVATTDTDNLEIVYQSSPFTFSCKLRAAEDLAELLRFFAAKGVRLGDGARRKLGLQ